MKVLKIRQHGMLVAFLFVPSLVFWCWRDVYEADKFMQRHKTGDSVPIFPCKESTAGQMLNILNSNCIGSFPTFGMCKFVVLIEIVCFPPNVRLHCEFCVCAKANIVDLVFCQFATLNFVFVHIQLL